MSALPREIRKTAAQILRDYPMKNKLLRASSKGSKAQGLANISQEVKAVEDVLATLSNKKQKLVRLKYFQQGALDTDIALELGWSERTLYRRANDILSMLALRLGLEEKNRKPKPGELEQRAQQENETATNWLLWCYDSGTKAAIESGQLDREQAQAWLKLVQDIEQALPLRDKVYLRLRRKYRHRRGRHGWADQVQHELPREMERLTGKPAEQFWIANRNSFTRWMDRIIEHTVREALRRQVL
jgi:uncharacterized protein YbcC (UPF0753/DUF2309 family)